MELGAYSEPNSKTVPVSHMHRYIDPREALSSCPLALTLHKDLLAGSCDNCILYSWFKEQR